MIVGIVHFYSKIKYGYNKRNTPIYLFTPYDKTLPTYKVASSEPDKTHNQIAVVDTKIPSAPYIVKLIGLVGESKAEGKAMYLHYSPFAVYNAKTVERLMCSVIPSETVKRVDISHLPTINVDPDGTKDIDDIISFDLPNVYITIADVASYLRENSEIDLHARKIGQTLYYPELPPHTMFPPQFESLATLSVGSVRNGVTLKYNMKTKISSFMLTTVINKDQLTYDDVYSSKYAAILSKLSSDFGVRSNDSHKWIESCMLHYNCEAAKLLEKQKTGLFRKQNLSEAQLAVHPDLANLGSAATYTSIPELHAGIGKLYCHATSPLRRYVDIINQRVIHSILENKESVIIPPEEEFNLLQKQSKKFNRDSFFLALVLTKPSGNVDGVVTEVTEEYIQFYVPKWKRILKKKKTENVEVGYSITVDYLSQPDKVFWKDRILFRISNINYQAQ
jgi:exoribonuclease R